MSDLDKKKAELARLKELKKMQEQGVNVDDMITSGTNPCARPFMPPGQAPAPAGGNTSGTTYGFAYDDEDEDDQYYDDDTDGMYGDDLDAEMEAFEQEAANAAAAGGSAPAAVMVNAHMSQRALGNVSDFEVLRLAKIGDVQSFLNFVAEEGIDVAKFTDNKERTCLHYAADGGSVELVTKLLVDFKAPLAKDEVGMTALDIAVLVGHDEVATAIRNNASADDVAKSQYTTKEQLLGAFAPQPPRLSLSKAAPAVPVDNNRPRAFWGAKAPKSAPASDVETQCFEPGAFPTPAKEIADIYKNATYPYHPATSWAYPLTEEELDGVKGAAAIVGSATDGTVNGTAVVLPIYGVKSGAMEIQSAVVGGWVVGDAARAPVNPQRPVAQAALHAIKNFLQPSPINCAWFHTALTLPMKPVCTAKWFRKIVDVNGLINTGDAAAAAIFSDFIRYETTLRTDATLKGTPNPAAVAALGGWYHVSSEADKTNSYQAIGAAVAKKAAATPSAFHVTADGESLRQLFDRPGLNVFIKAGANGETGSVLVLRDRKSLTGNSKAAVIAFAIFEGSGDAFLLEAAAAAQQLGYHAVYATNTMSFTDKDMRLSFFEEVKESHEFIYAVADPAAATSAVTAKAADICLPVFLL